MPAFSGLGAIGLTRELVDQCPVADDYTSALAKQRLIALEDVEGICHGCAAHPEVNGKRPMRGGNFVARDTVVEC